MAQSIIDEIGHILPPSRNLAETLARAAEYANQQSHPEVTLEHLLLALTEDPDAARVLAVSAVQIDPLKGDISSHLGRLEDRSAPGGAAGISTDLRQILEASAAAARGRRNAIDGAIVLAAIVGDGRSTAAHLLRAHGLTFEEAIKALQAAIQEDDGPPEPAPSPEERPSRDAALPDDREAAANAGELPVSEPSPGYHAGGSADEILASARQRVQGRIAPGLPADAEAPTEMPIATDQAAAAEVAVGSKTVPDARPNAGEPHQDDPAEPGNVAVASDEAAPSEPRSDDPQFTGPGAHPAPPARRPLPPGAIREHGAQEGEAHEAGDLPRNGYAASPDGATNSGDTRITKETAIDEVLASIRKSGKPAAGPTDAFPPPRPAPASPHAQVPQTTGVPPQPSPERQGAMPPPPRELHPATPASATSVPPARGPAPRPSDRDFFGPSVQGHGQSRAGTANAAPLPPPAPPGRFAGPPRAPLPGLPPVKGAPPPGVAPPPPPSGPRPHQPPRADQQAMPPVPGARPPGPAPAPSPATAPPPATAPGAPPARQRASEISLGQMVENIPRAMRVGIPVVVEARVARSEVKALADGLQGRGAVWRHELTVTKAMSVRLRAPDGGFFIETASPETQWIENTNGLMTDDYASWRWTVTPKERGAKRLQLVISARTVGTDGLAAETALPDQIVNVKVRVNFARTAKRVGGWALAAVAGGILARFGEDLPAALLSLIGGIVK